MHRPTVVTGVTPEMRIYGEESFGPVVTVVTADGVDDAVRVANDTEYGLSAAVFGQDTDRALGVAARIQSGICHVNGATVHDEADRPVRRRQGVGLGTLRVRPGRRGVHQPALDHRLTRGSPLPDLMSGPLLAVPNVSEGRAMDVLDTIGAAFAAGGSVRMLDRHGDPDHHRAVFTFAGAAGEIAPALASGAQAAIAHIDLRAERGLHPHVGALDIAPVVHLDARRRGAACAEALLAGSLLGELGLPVFLYGALAGGRTRADIRRGGPARLAQRLAAGEIDPDFGPRRLHPTAGAVLVGARPPLIAFNIELAPPASLYDAARIAALVREGGAEGLTGLRAIGLSLAARDDVAQVSCNVEDHLALPLARVVEAVGRHARVAECELVGLAPAAAFAGFPGDLVVRNRRTIEDALEAGRGA